MDRNAPLILNLSSVAAGHDTPNGASGTIEDMHHASAPVSPEKSSMIKEDHRKRVARERRERMEAHLLRSVLKVFHERPSTDRIVIEDVITHANVSRGTFYQYFPSLNDAIAQLAGTITEDMLSSVLTVYDSLADPKMRTACGFQMYLLRACMDKGWGAFMMHIGLLQVENAMLTKIIDDIALGVGTGDYDVSSIAVAAELLLGAKTQAIGRIISGQADLSYVHALTEQLLMSFGVNRSRARSSVSDAYDYIVREAPGNIPWWRNDEVSFGRDTTAVR